jgi:hypothetical protein
MRYNSLSALVLKKDCQTGSDVFKAMVIQNFILFFFFFFFFIKGTSSRALLTTSFILLVLFFYPENGGNMFLRNVTLLSTDYTALCLGRGLVYISYTWQNS